MKSARQPIEAPWKINDLINLTLTKY